MKKVFIGFPVLERNLDVEILMSFAELEGELCLDFVSGSIVSEGRNYLVRRFLQTDFEWLFFWDNDIVIRRERSGSGEWGPDFLSQLIETSEKLDAPIVGAAYRMKNPTGLVIGGMRGEDGKIHNLPANDLTEPRVVDAVGTGTMLIHRKVLESLADPYFEFVHYPNWVMPEDYDFCLKAKEKGFKTAIDPRIRTVHYGKAPWIHLPNKGV